MPKVSIIIPVYNAENYLRRCVDSVLKQTLTDIEILLIDDGSTDGSGKICDEYSRNNSNITVIHQQNSGASSARNAGLEAATGDYIGFVDADDYINNNMYADLYTAAVFNNAEIVFGNIVAIDEHRESIFQYSSFIQEKKRISNNEIRRLICESHPKYLFWFVTKGIFSRTMLLDNGIKFQNGNYGEDSLFNLETFCVAKNIWYINENYYYYVQTSESIIRGGYKAELHIHLNDAYLIRKALLEKYKLSDYQKSLWQDSMTHSLIILLSNEIKNPSSRIDRIDTLRQIRNSEMVDEAFKHLSVNIIISRIKWAALLLKFKCYGLLDFLLQRRYMKEFCFDS